MHTYAQVVVKKQNDDVGARDRAKDGHGIHCLWVCMYVTVHSCMLLLNHVCYRCTMMYLFDSCMMLFMYVPEWLFGHSLSVIMHVCSCLIHVRCYPCVFLFDSCMMLFMYVPEWMFGHSLSVSISPNKRTVTELFNPIYTYIIHMHVSQKTWCESIQWHTAIPIIIEGHDTAFNGF